MIQAQGMANQKKENGTAKASQMTRQMASPNLRRDKTQSKRQDRNQGTKTKRQKPKTPTR